MSERKGPALGLTTADSPEEVRRVVTDAILKVGYVVLATVGLDGVTPTTRGMEVHRLDESEYLYIGLCPGKPVYAELKKNPRVSGGLAVNTVGRLTYGIRITAKAVEVEDPKLMARYWELNPGTAALYRRAPENFSIFRLEQMEGEIMDVYEDDKLLRFRFATPDTQPRPWAYRITDSCIGCGQCAQRCMTQVITISEGRACIDHARCLECGVCAAVCPVGAVKDCREWGENA